MKGQNMFDVANPAGFDRIEIGAGLQSLIPALTDYFQDNMFLYSPLFFPEKEHRPLIKSSPGIDEISCGKSVELTRISGRVSGSGNNSIRG